VHVPEGAIPKDGPLAGITMARSRCAGRCCPSGGLNEKILAVRRAGIDTIVCPKLNQKELDEVPAHLRRSIAFHLVDDVEEVLRLALDVCAADDAASPPGSRSHPPG
jgi:ATP-dependent Lon protease